MDVPGQALTTSPSANGRFRLALPAGLWAVTVPTWVNGKLSYRAHAIPVAGGRTSTFRVDLRAGQQPPPFRIAAEGWKTGGEFPSETGPGYDGLMIHGLLQAFDKSCGKVNSPTQQAAVVENRDGRVFKAVLNEIKLGMSRYADAEFRAMAKRAVANLKVWAPTHKVSGSITSTTTNGVRTDTATVRLVNLKTGQTEWQNTYSKDGDDSFWADVPDTAGQDIANHLCGLPAGLHISATAKVRAEDDDASGTADLKIDYDVWSRPDEPTLYWVDAPASWSITNPTLTAKGTCPKVSTGTSAPTEAVFVGQGAAAINDATPRVVKVFIGSTVTTNWQETTPPDECTNGGSLLLIFNVLNLSVPLGGTASAKGSTVPGVTYDITATVTPLSKRP